MIHALFDLDNTLYDHPPHRDEMDRRIELFFQEKLELDPDAAHALRVKYRETYGTALRGLIVHHQTVPGEFLDYVHRGLPRHQVKPWPCAKEVLRDLGVPCSIFSNAPEDYVERMLDAMDLSGYFTRVFGIAATGYIGKPAPRAYRKVLEALSLQGPDCLFVEDQIRNLGPAKALGMTTVFLGEGDVPPGFRTDVDYSIRAFKELKEVFRKIREMGAA